MVNLGASMLDKFSENLNVLSRSSNQRVSSLISSMKLEKYDLEAVARSVANYGSFADYTASRIAPISLLDREPIVDLFRDSYLRMRQMFSVANAIGLIVNSMADVLASDIAKVESDISDLEVFIDNYDFLSGKDDNYNSNYIEKFDSNSGNISYDNLIFEIPDRDGFSFDLNGNGFVDSSLGVFKMGKKYSRKNVVGKVDSVKIVSNSSSYFSTQEDFENVFNDKINRPWSNTVKSPVILTTQVSDVESLVGYDVPSFSGLQLGVEVSFTAPVYMDTIRISPNLCAGSDLMQVIVYVDEESSIDTDAEQRKFFKVLSGPVSISVEKEFSFPKSLVSKIYFIFNQKSYVRTAMVPVASEVSSKGVQSFIDRRYSERRNDFSLIQDVSYFWFRKYNSVNGIRSNSAQSYDFYSHMFPQETSSYKNVIQNEIYMANNYDYLDRPMFHESPVFIDLASSIMEYLDENSYLIDSDLFVESNSNRKSVNSFGDYGFLVSKNSNSKYPIRSQYYSTPVKGGGVKDALRILTSSEEPDGYEYSLSINKIEFLETDLKEINKSCFVSKRISLGGQPAAVKAKYKYLDADQKKIPQVYDLTEDVSYELSISNSSKPEDEDQWYPIASYDQQSVSSEVVYFDPYTYKAKTRFFGLRSSVLLYKDGILCPTSSYSYNDRQKTLYLRDMSMFSPESVFVVSYDFNLNLANPYEIDFMSNNIYSDSKKRYFDSSGMGQRFSQTGADRSVKLDYVPYVNRAYANSASYSSSTGTIFSGSGKGYSPVRVKLSDGSYALNMTNYSNSKKKEDFSSVEGIAFIQKGNNIVFNQSISSSFVVDYEYVPDNLRFRLVMRKNIPSYSSPAKVDSVILKAKTFEYSQYYDDLNYVSIGNR